MSHLLGTRNEDVKRALGSSQENHDNQGNNLILEESKTKEKSPEGTILTKLIMAEAICSEVAHYLNNT